MRSTRRRLDIRSLKFLYWLPGHYCPESNRIAEVRLLWACIQVTIDVGVLGCSRVGWGPGQPRADLACASSRSLTKTLGTILWSITLGRKVLPWAVTDRNTCGEGVLRWALKWQPCSGRDTVLSQMGMTQAHASCLWSQILGHACSRWPAETGGLGTRCVREWSKSPSI